jgi:hypothetical protein
MIGEVKYLASWTMDELARTCTVNENDSFAVLTALRSIEPAANIANFVRANSRAGSNDLLIVAKGIKPNLDAKLLFTASIYVQNALADVDIYRQN